MRANNHRFDGIILEAKLFDTIFDLTLGLTRGGGGEGGRGWWMPTLKVFLSFFLNDKTSAADVFSSYSFVPHAQFETGSVMVSCYGYEI